MTESFIPKALASLISALMMYWMYVPPSYAVILVLILADTIFGGLVAFRDHKFSGRRLFWGSVAKFAAFPMALICGRIEEPLHIGFHLETAFLLTVMAFEFISVVQRYTDLGGVGSSLLLEVSHRLRTSLKVASLATTFRKVETTTERVEVEATQDHPSPPAPITTTTMTESHVEKAVKADPAA